MELIRDGKGCINFSRTRQASRYRAIVDLQGAKPLFLGVLFQAIGYRLVRVNWGYREKARLIRSKNKILKPLTHTVFALRLFSEVGFYGSFRGTGDTAQTHL